MAIAKIILNGVTQMDVTQDTVAANNLLTGYTATGADGNSVTGAYVPSSSITVNALSVVENGTYTAASGTAYSPVIVNVSEVSSLPLGAITVTYVFDPSDDYIDSRDYGVCQYFPAEVEYDEPAALVVPSVLDHGQAVGFITPQVVPEIGLGVYFYCLRPNFTDDDPTNYHYEITYSNLVNMWDMSGDGISGAAMIADPTQSSSCTATVTRTAN